MVQVAEFLALSPLPLLATSLVLLLLLFRYPREWESISWKYLLSSFIIAIMVGISMALYLNWAVAYSFYALTLSLMISLRSDLKYRKVRSDLLWILALGAIPSWVFLPQVERVAFVGLLLAGFVGLLLPFFGQSDARAWVMITSVIMPLYGVRGMLVGLLIFFILVLLISVVSFLGVFGEEKLKNFSKLRVSLPAVPIMSGSFLTSLIVITFFLS